MGGHAAEDGCVGGCLKTEENGGMIGTACKKGTMSPTNVNANMAL